MALNLYYQIPAFLQRLYRGVVWRFTPSEKIIYLTFDDGCIPEVTPRVLDILDRYQVKATFFCVGDNIRKYPDLLQDILRRGHAVGNHTFNHVKGWRCSISAYLDNVRKTDELLDRYHPAGKDRPRFFRPPYGRVRFSQRMLLCRTHTIVLWDVLTHDYSAAYTPERIMDIIRFCSRNGSVVLFHDSLKAAPRMLVALPQAIEYWLSEGYKISCLPDHKSD